MEFGKRLRNLRKKMNMTLKQFAAPLNVDLATISAYEEGKIFPSLKILRKINRHYRINMNWLFIEEGEEYLNDKNDELRKKMIQMGLTPEDLKLLQLLKAYFSEEEARYFLDHPLYLILMEKFVKTGPQQTEELNWLLTVLEELKKEL